MALERDLIASIDLLFVGKFDCKKDKEGAYVLTEQGDDYRGKGSQLPVRIQFLQTTGALEYKEIPYRSSTSLCLRQFRIPDLNKFVGILSNPSAFSPESNLDKAHIMSMQKAADKLKPYVRVEAAGDRKRDAPPTSAPASAGIKATLFNSPAPAPSPEAKRERDPLIEWCEKNLAEFDKLKRALNRFDLPLSPGKISEFGNTAEALKNLVIMIMSYPSIQSFLETHPEVDTPQQFAKFKKDLDRKDNDPEKISFENRLALRRLEEIVRPLLQQVMQHRAEELSPEIQVKNAILWCRKTNEEFQKIVTNLKFPIPFEGISEIESHTMNEEALLDFLETLFVNDKTFQPYLDQRPDLVSDYAQLKEDLDNRKIRFTDDNSATDKFEALFNSALKGYLNFAAKKAAGFQPSRAAF